MVTHWESSRRPLYVRTVWKDGQHHVILDKTKETPLEISQYRKSKQCSSNQNSHRSAKSANTGTNLKVSSVRVLLSGVSGFKNSQKSVRIEENLADKPRTWLKPATSRPITSKNLNKEVTFNTIQGTKAPKLCKSNTLGSECITIDKPSEPILEYVPNNALSEKVMIWLDLAIQNGHINKEVKQDRAVTAQACHLLEKPRRHCEVKVNNNAQEVISSSILTNITPRQDSEKEEMIVYSNEEVEVDQDFYHVLTPTVDDYLDCDCEETIIKEKKKRVSTAKRQLHIFMPNLPKRASDCDSSILSSKVSVS